MHWLDRAAAFASARMPPEKRPFSAGWGDEHVIARYLREISTVPPLESARLLQRAARRSGGTIVRDVSFPSPHDGLPDAVRIARARWITKWPEPKRIVVLHPGWNDESYATRTRLARLLLAENVASIMPQQPFYGDRRRDPEAGAPIMLVSDFCLMGRAAVLEGRALAATFHERGYQVGVAGYSMGGNIAGFVTASVHFPVASAPIAASYSPGPVFFDGILRHTIAWEALGGPTDHNLRTLREIIGAASILDFPPPPHTRAAVLLAATKDGLVPNATTLRLHHHWPGSKLDWVTAGHGSLLWMNRDRIVGAIVESFERLDEFGPEGDFRGEG